MKPDEALACYDAALVLSPDLRQAHNDRGIALAELGQLDEAVVCYRQAIELKPFFPGVHNNLGNAL